MVTCGEREDKSHTGSGYLWSVVMHATGDSISHPQLASPCVREREKHCLSCGLQAGDKLT